MGAGLDDLPIVHSVSKQDKDVSRRGEGGGWNAERERERRQEKVRYQDCEPSGILCNAGDATLIGL